jgi:hypothetical protein
MSVIQYIARGSCLISLAVLLAGCVLAPREGYYDRHHHRYYHDHSWHQCRDRDDRDDSHCRD